MVRLQFTNTESLTYHTQRVNVCEDFYPGKQLKVHFIMTKTKKQSVKWRTSWTGKQLKSLSVGWQNVFIENQERRIKEGKGSEEEHSEKIH